MMFFGKSPKPMTLAETLGKTPPNTRLTYPPAGAAALRAHLIEQLPTMPPQQAANAIAAALAQITARGAWKGQTAENMANLISRAVDDIARQNPTP